MATTSAELGARLIDALAPSGIEFAFLHNECAAANGNVVSDYDLIARATGPGDILRRAFVAWRGCEVLPVAACEYDFGSVAVWLSTTAAEEGVQIDFTYDVTTANQFSTPLASWIDSAVQGERWPTVHPTNELLYRERKRALKAGSWRSPCTVSRVRRESARIAGRLYRSSGFIMQADFQDLAARHEFIVRFGRFLPRAQLLHPAGNVKSRAAAQLRAAAQARRPGLIVIHTDKSQPLPWSQSDLIINNAVSLTLDDLARQTVRCMNRKLEWTVGRARTNASPSGNDRERPDS